MKKYNFNIKELNSINKMIDSLFWDYDRMSSSGQETLEKLNDMFNANVLKNNYIIYDTKIDRSIFKELLNIKEMYDEDFLNEDSDCFKGTEDSYVNERLDSNLSELFSHTVFQKFKDDNNLLEDIETEEDEYILDSRIISEMKSIIKNDYDLKSIFKVDMLKNKENSYEV